MREVTVFFVAFGTTAATCFPYDVHAEPWLPDSFMAELSIEAIRQLRRHGKVRRDIASIVLTGGDAAVIVVLSGAIKIFRSHSSGKQTLVHVAGPGDVVNAEPSLTGSDMAHTALGARVFTEVLTLSRQQFRRLVARDEDIQHALMRSFARSVQAHETWRGHIGRTTEARVWTFLVGLARRHGRQNDLGTYLGLELTQLEIASALGISISSVENVMRNLRDAEKLKTGRSSIWLREIPSEEALDRDF